MAAAIPSSPYPVMGINSTPPNRIIYGPYFGSKPAYQLAADAAAKGVHIGDIIAADASEQARAAGKPNPVIDHPQNNKYWISPITGSPEMMPSNLAAPGIDTQAQVPGGSTSVNEQAKQLAAEASVVKPGATSTPTGTAPATGGVVLPPLVGPRLPFGQVAPAAPLSNQESPSRTEPIVAPPQPSNQASRPEVVFASRINSLPTRPATRIGATKDLAGTPPAVEISGAVTTTGSPLSRIPSAMARQLASSYSNLGRDERLAIRAAIRQGGTREV